MNFQGIDDVLPEDVGRHILSFLDVPTLVQKKNVCRSWRILFTNTINQKAPTPNAFTSHVELKVAVKKNAKHNLVDAEEFAQTYGWPIDRWDVSRIKKFSRLFDLHKESFNEDIGSWNVSNATDMACMFVNAQSFNQDLSFWNVSNVTNMNSLFYGARSFNQDISSWDTSNVTTMESLFYDARSFNQDLSSWDTSNVRNMRFMFCDAILQPRSFFLGYLQCHGHE
eukprot:scaffold295518_cov38-Attheya_sp.AAC.1